MLKLLRRVFLVAFLLLALRYRAYLLDTESQLLYGLLPLFLASFFLFERPVRTFRFSDGLLLAFLGVFGVSCVFAQHPFGFFEFTTFFVGTLIYCGVRFVKLPTLPYKETFVGLGAAFSAFALVHFSLMPTDRLSGFFHGYESYTFYPNAAALFLLPVLIFNFELCFSKQRLWQGLLFLNAAAFLLTFSRGAYLVALLCAGLACLLFARQLCTHKVLRKLAAVAFTLVLSLGFALGLNFLKTDGLVLSERLLLKDDAGFTSVSERLDFWKGAWEMSLDHPWLGVGPGGFAHFYPFYQDTWLALSDHPHNVLLKLSSEVGFPAALLFSAFLAALFSAALKSLWSAPRSSEVVLSLAALAFVLHNLLDYNLNFTLLSALLFVLLAALENKRPSSIGKKISRVGFVFLALLCLGVSTLTLWEGVRLVEAQNMQNLYETDPDNEAVREYVQNPVFLPFEMSHFDLEGTLALELGEEEVLDAFLLRFQKYSAYDRWLYFKTRLDPSFADELLEANPKNEMEYYLLYYAAQPVDLVDVGEIEKLITNYTSLLAQNEHMTVLSQNPKYTEKLCELYPEELAQSCDIFDWIWGLEVYKFNQRYGTALTTDLSLDSK